MIISVVFRSWRDDKPLFRTKRRERRSEEEKIRASDLGTCFCLGRGGSRMPFWKLKTKDVYLDELLPSPLDDYAVMFASILTKLDERQFKVTSSFIT